MDIKKKYLSTLKKRYLPKRFIRNGMSRILI